MNIVGESPSGRPFCPTVCKLIAQREGAMASATPLHLYHVIRQPPMLTRRVVIILLVAHPLRYWSLCLFLWLSLWLSLWRGQHS